MKILLKTEKEIWAQKLCIIKNKPMNKEKWENIKGRVKDGFKIEDEGAEYFEDEGGINVEYLIFNGPIGKTRLEFVSKPIVLDKKTIYSRRIGSETKIDYIYSDSEKSEQLFIYKWDEAQGDWIEVDSNNFNI